jgi:hypothetical protein
MKFNKFKYYIGIKGINDKDEFGTVYNEVFELDGYQLQKLIDILEYTRIGLKEKRKE